MEGRDAVEWMQMKEREGRRIKEKVKEWKVGRYMEIMKINNSYYEKANNSISEKFLYESLILASPKIFFIKHQQNLTITPNGAIMHIIAPLKSLYRGGFNILAFSKKISKDA